MKIKLIAALSVIIAACLLASACQRRGAGGRRVIAVIPKGVSHFFWQSVHAGAEAAGKESNVEIAWKGPAQETDYAGQITIVEDAINSHVDGIQSSPTHRNTLIP